MARARIIPFRRGCTIEGHPAIVLIDTGADMTIIPRNVLTKYVNVYPTSYRIRAANGTPISLVGSVYNVEIKIGSC